VTAPLHSWLLAQWQRPRPAVAALVLRPLAWLFGAASALQRGLYASGLRQARRAPRPTVVVGNLVAGGAGKTPAVIAIVQALQAQGRVPGVVSRGYGRRGRGVVLVERGSAAAEVGDEPLLIALRTGAPVAVGADRVAAAQVLCERHPDVDAIVADDGLQHRRLARDVDVLVFDDRGAGNGRLLPAGPLRQPMPSALPPRSVVLYSAGRASTPLPGFVGRRRLAGVVPLADWWADPNAPARPLSALAGRTLVAAAGLARPEGFFEMLEGAGLQPRRLPLADHDPLERLPWPDEPIDVVVTEKDAVKLPPARAGRARVWVARLDFEPEPGFVAALSRLLPSRTPPGGGDAAAAARGR
jgi:tetraacyldisaccharide 4'-kinase